MIARRNLRISAVVASTLLIILGLGGCGGGPDDKGIATAGKQAPSATATGPSPAADNAQRIRQYVSCLRAHGVKVADPEAGKQVQLDEDRPQDKQAAQACRQYLPESATTRGGDTSAMREYAACMRRQGLADFPDPDPDRGLLLPKSILNDPEYGVADRACAGKIKAGKK
jgi:hypothetical protein